MRIFITGATGFIGSWVAFRLLRAGHQLVALARNPSTQFIWAGDLARLYQAVLESDHNREVYFGLAEPFVTWQHIAEQTVLRARSQSRILLEGRGGPPELFDLGKIWRHFGFRFESQEHLLEHIDYWLTQLAD